MEFRILGPLEVRTERGALQLGGSKPRAVLAVLLLNANESVSPERLAMALWGDETPTEAVKTLRVHVSRLRKALGDPDVLATTPAGYRLRVQPGELDAERFESLVKEGRRTLRAGAPAEASTMLGEALSLWRGEALADLTFAPFAATEISRLEEHRLAAVEDRIEADLADGRHAALVGELQRLVDAHPVRERLAGQQMLALYRCGRQTDALDAYRTARERLVEQAGVDPGRELRRLHEAILRQDASLELQPQSREPKSPASDPSRVGVEMPRSLHVPDDDALVAREMEVNRLTRLWHRATAGKCAAVVVAGEAGIGKTRLAAEIGRLVHGEGGLVLYGRCDEGLAVPYQPFVEAFRPHVGAMDAAWLRAELGHLAPELVRLLPDVGAIGDPTRADPETERFAMFQAVSALLETLTRHRRALIVLEDLHWAPAPTVLLVRHLVRSERRLRALILATYRDTDLEPGEPPAQRLADVQGDAAVETLRLEGLDESGIAALVTQAIGRSRAIELAPRLRLLTGGNPFFVGEFLAHLRESGALAVDRHYPTTVGTLDVGVPDRLRHVIRRRIARLSPPARRVVAVAAVSGTVFSLAQLEDVLNRASFVLDALDEAVRAGLLTETGPGSFAFAHALVRETVYEGLSSTRRMRLHRQLGEQLESRTDADKYVEALAHHFAEAASDGQARKAAAYALVAGRNATARLGYEEAAAHYERGLHALEVAKQPEDESVCELLLALAFTRWRTDEPDKAREASLRAAAVAETVGSRTALARAALSFAGPPRFEVLTAMTDPVVELLERALAELGQEETMLRARLMARLAATFAFSATERRMPGLARRALEMARRHAADRAGLADVLVTSFWATRGPDDLDDRMTDARELAALAAELGDVGLSEAAHEWMFNDLLELGDAAGSERELAVIERFPEALRGRWRSPRYFAASARARLAYLDAQLDDAEALASAALDLGYGDQESTQGYQAQIFAIRREQGRLGELVEAVEGFVAQLPEVTAWRCALAYTYAELERPSEARRELQALSRSGFSNLPRDEMWALNLSLLSDVVAYVEDPQRAQPLYDLLLPYANRCVVAFATICQGSVSRPLGLLAAAMSRYDDARRHFDNALRMNSAIKSRLWVAWTEYGYAQMQLAGGHRGDREHALHLLSHASTSAKELRLTALEDRTRALWHRAETPLPA